MIPTAPCKDCKDRELGCHSKCQKYLDYKDDKAEFDKQMKKIKEMDDYAKSVCSRIKEQKAKAQKKNWRMSRGKEY